MKSPSFNPKLRAAVDHVLDQQLRDNDPPETGATLERLLGEGIDRQEARRLIACVILGELFTILKQRASFDRQRFVDRLAILPEMPWLDDEVEAGPT